MGFIKEYRDLFEFIYFICSSLMLVSIWVGISQLRLLRRESNARVERETVALTLSVIERKMRDIESFFSKAYSLECYKKLPEFEGEIKGIYRSMVHPTNNWLDIFDSDECADFWDAMVDVANELETLAHYLQSGITDEELSYKLEGPIFLSFIEEFKPYIAVFRDDEDDHKYVEILNLYEKWKQKQEHDGLVKRSKGIAKLLANKSRPKSVPVIGRQT